ncbi:MAG TPA: hypothetical protein VEZ11_02150 [Thermoanaerobaculia bacterium]|nr:hypothetical protein [Thermoanaerobaculia bacterium]
MSLTIFHFRCNLCGAKPQPVDLRDYLNAWVRAPREHVDALLQTVAGALTELTSRWVTKKARRALDETLACLTTLTIPGPAHLSELDGRLFFSVTCPVCYTDAGPRTPDKYIATWSNACRVQTGNLLYETSLILWSVTASVPLWADATTLHELEDLRESLRNIAGAMRLSECPQCGRWTTCLFGDPHGPHEAQFCRWCLDAGGGGAIRVALKIDPEGRPIVEVKKSDPLAPGRAARDLLPPRLSE